MRIINTSYITLPEFNDPEAWLKRISLYTGVLAELSKKHEVISIEQINFRGKLERKGVSHHFIGIEKKKNLFPRKLHQYIKNLKPELVLVHGMIFPFQVLQLRMKMGKNVKIIVQNHSEKPFTGIKKYLQRLQDRYVDGHFFPSYEIGTDWVYKGNLASANKIHEIMEVSSVFHPMDKNISRSKSGGNGAPVFLWVGRLHERKDPLTVVRAFLKFVKINPGARLYMIYHTEELLPEIKKLLETEPTFVHSVKLVGKIPPDEMEAWYNSSDFYLMGSHYEGTLTALSEAMSCGCIPIVTDIATFRKMTGESLSQFLFEPGNEKALLSILMKTQSLDMITMREKVLKQFREQLSFESIANKIHQVITSL